MTTAPWHQDPTELDYTMVHYSGPVYNSTMSRQFMFRVTADTKARAVLEKLRVNVFNGFRNEFVQEYQDHYD